MIQLLEAAEFDQTELTNDEATRDRVREELSALAKSTEVGAHVVVYFSGHGATLPDLNQDELGVLRDGAWFLYDGMLVDDELTEALTEFEEGVRVVLISDSCFTGTIVSDALLNPREEEDPSTIDTRSSKLAPVDIGDRVYEAQKDFYDPILTRPPADPDDAKAAVLILSACEKGELARVDEEGVSVFTRTLVTVWNDGRFTGTYGELFDRVSTAVTEAVPLQHPVKRLAGNQPSPTLEHDRPFGLYPQTPPWTPVVPAAMSDTRP